MPRGALTPELLRGAEGIGAFVQLLFLFLKHVHLVRDVFHTEVIKIYVHQAAVVKTMAPNLPPPEVVMYREALPAEESPFVEAPAFIQTSETMLQLRPTTCWLPINNV